MTRKNHGVSTNAIIASLEQDGPQTRAELEISCGIPKDNIAAVISRLNKRTAKMGKRIHIIDYTHESETSQRDYPRAIYAVGDGEDAKKPKPKTRKEIRNKYDAKVRNKFRMNSVFNLAMNREQIKNQLKKSNDKSNQCLSS